VKTKGVPCVGQTPTVTHFYRLYIIVICLYLTRSGLVTSSYERLV